jgi:hypothetical protein
MMANNDEHGAYSAPGEVRLVWLLVHVHPAETGVRKAPR